MKLSTDMILNAATKTVTSSRLPLAGKKHLDVGSGTGALISLLQSTCTGLQSSACDYTDILMKIPGQKVDIVDLNTKSLPYESDSFDLITCTEVIEHLENYHKLVREIYRVSKPGGFVIFTTPNILNINSRLRNLFFGFANLFGPLPVSRIEAFSTVGHITPVSYFYLVHTLAEAGFTDIKLETDKSQRSAIPKLILLWPAIVYLGFLAKRKEINKYKTIDHTNRYIVDNMNSIKMLLGRTIVVSAQKSVV